MILVSWRRKLLQKKEQPLRQRWQKTLSLTLVHGVSGLDETAAFKARLCLSKPHQDIPNQNSMYYSSFRSYTFLL